MKVIDVVKQLMKIWAKKVTLQKELEDIVTEIIESNMPITRRMLPFSLSINPVM